MPPACPPKRRRREGGRCSMTDAALARIPCRTFRFCPRCGAPLATARPRRRRRPHAPAVLLAAMRLRSLRQPDPGGGGRGRARRQGAAGEEQGVAGHVVRAGGRIPGARRDARRRRAARGQGRGGTRGRPAATHRRLPFHPHESGDPGVPRRHDGRRAAWRRAGGLQAGGAGALRRVAGRHGLGAARLAPSARPRARR